MSETITRVEALKIAEDDAGKYYQDLSIYEVTIKGVDQSWIIDYELINKELNGGGPHYVISMTTGEIQSAIFEQ